MLILAAGCAVRPKQAAAPDGALLDQAIREAAVRIDERVEAGTKIALLNFNSPSEQFSLYVLDELTANLLDSRKLTVVDRKELYLIRNEFALQLSGDVEDNSMQELGRMLGAQSIVSGSLTEIGGSYRIVIRVLNVQSAAIVAQYRTDIANDKRVSALLASGKAGETATASGGLPSGTATAASGSGTVTVIRQPFHSPSRDFAAPASGKRASVLHKRREARGTFAAPSGMQSGTTTASNRGGRETAAKHPSPTPSHSAAVPAAKTAKREGALQKAAAAAPAPAGASIFFKTLPANADVYIGGRFIGKSNTGELQVPAGTHKVRFVKGDIDKTFTFTFNPGKNETKFVPLK